MLCSGRNVVGCAQSLGIPEAALRRFALLGNKSRDVLRMLGKRPLVRLPLLKSILDVATALDADRQREGVHHCCSGALAQCRSHPMGRVADNRDASGGPADQLTGLISI